MTVLLGAKTATSSMLSPTTATVSLGQSVPLTLAVSDTVSAFSSPTGTATFSDGATVLGTASQATSPYTFNASGLSAGIHTLSATYGGDPRSFGSTSNSVTIQVDASGSQSQTITFGPLSNQSLGSSPQALNASASSGLRVTFTSSTASVCTVAGVNITLVSGGTCSITAHQTGNATYAAAPSITQNFQVYAPQTIAFDAIPGQILGGSPFPISAKASSGLPVALASSTPIVCKATGGLVTLLSAGTCSITATQGGGASYSAASSVTRSFTVSLANPSGTLVAATGSPFAAGSEPGFTVTGDFNGDGISDLATASCNASTVTILLGNGSGGFTAAPGGPILVDGCPNWLAIGDFNGDGLQDIATANAYNNDVAVLLGNGSGGFAEAPGGPIAVGNLPLSVSVGDFNGDGIPDLAVANGSDNNVTVLLGNGSGGGTAAPGSPFATGNGPTPIALADFNGDGILDLAVGNYTDNNVTVLLGDDSGGFSAVTGSPFMVGNSPYSMVVGDFNGDGKPDLAVANYGDNTVTVLLGNGSGGFTAAAGNPFATGNGPNSLAAGDFNGDGRPDLAVANSGDDTVTILLGNGSGGFTAAAGGPFAAGSGSSFLAAGDFNGDGRPDVAIADYNTNNVTVLLGAAAATSSVLSTTSPLTIAQGYTVPSSLTVSDATPAFSSLMGTATFRDGSTVIGTATQTGSPYTFSASGLSVGSHTLTASYGGDTRDLSSTSNSITILVNAGLTPQTITFGTLNNEAGSAPPLSASASSGLPVTFTSNSTSICTVSGVNLTLLAPGTCSIMASQAGNAEYSAATSITQTFTVSVSPQSITFDAIPSQILGASPFVIAARPSSSLTIGIVSNTPAVCGTAGTLVMLTAAGTCSITASQAGNGVYSAATSVTRSFTVSAAKPSGTLTAATGSPVTVGAAPASVVTGDFNGDGKPDVAIANTDSNSVTVLLGNGSGGFTAATGSPIAVAGGPVSLVAGDFNGDGVQDLATVDTNSNSVTVLLGNGSGGFTVTGSPIAVGVNPQFIAVGDFNGDGVQDLAIANVMANSIFAGVPGSVTVLLGNGSGGFTAATSSPFAVGVNPASLTVGDFNGDGSQDLAVANNDDNTITLLLGNGSGGFTSAASGPLATGSGPQSVSVGDFNGDGKPDLVVANSNDNTVTVLLGNGSGGFTAATGSPFAVGASPFSVVVGDFNGDGMQDVATANFSDNDITVLLGNGSGEFTGAGGFTFAAGSEPDALAAGDFNGDGKLDLADVNYGSNNLTLMLGASAATNSVLTSTATTIASGNALQVTLNVSDAGNAFAAPTGTATFSDGATVLGTASQRSGPYTFSASGPASAAMLSPRAMAGMVAVSLPPATL